MQQRASAWALRISALVVLVLTLVLAAAGSAPAQAATVSLSVQVVTQQHTYTDGNGDPQCDRIDVLVAAIPDNVISYTASVNQVGYGLRQESGPPTSNPVTYGDISYDVPAGSAGWFLGYGSCEAKPTYTDAQGTGTTGSVLSGTVTDRCGDPVGGVTISVGSGSTTTASDGTYSIALAPNSYTVTPSNGNDTFQPASTTVDLSAGNGTANFVEQTCTMPTVSIADAPPVVRPETGQSAAIVFPVSISASPTQAVSVTASTADGTGSDAAVAGTDYQSTTETVTFPAGSTSTQDVTVPVIGTPPLGHSETFTVNLSSPQNATLGTASATGTILCSPTAPAPAADLRHSADARPRAAGSPCQLQVTTDALQGSPAAGLSDLNGFIDFQTQAIDLAAPTIEEDSSDVFTYTCVTGCSNIVVNVKDPSGQPVRGAVVTASLSSIVATPPAITVPSGNQGFLCTFPNTALCGSAATANTDDKGNAYFRYWLPGVVNTVTGGDPSALINVTAKGSLCSCNDAAGASHILSLTLRPHLYIDRDRGLSATDLQGLQALLDKAKEDKAKQKKSADKLLKLLYDSGVITDKDLRQLIGDAKGLAESDEVDELLRRAPKLIELDWFMTQLQIPADGLEYDTASVTEWGRELSQDLVPILADRAFKHLGLLKKLEGKVTAAVDKATASLLGNSWMEQVGQVVAKLIQRKVGGTMTLKLFEVSRCTDTKVFGNTCPLGPPAQSDGLFMAFSITDRHAGTNFYESPNVVPYSPKIWIPLVCGTNGSGCQEMPGTPAEVAGPATS
jgi:hypothetical protein